MLRIGETPDPLTHQTFKLAEIGALKHWHLSHHYRYYVEAILADEMLLEQDKTQQPEQPIEPKEDSEETDLEFQNRQEQLTKSLLDNFSDRVEQERFKQNNSELINQIETRIESGENPHNVLQEIKRDYQDGTLEIVTQPQPTYKREKRNGGYQLTLEEDDQLSIL